MGDVWGDGNFDQRPVHIVTVDTFYLSKYEITNSQFANFLNVYNSDVVKSGDYAGNTMVNQKDQGVIKTDGVWQAAPGYENHPVITIRWYSAVEFCNFYNYRLPTEAEWEYAARSGGQHEKYPGTNSLSMLGEFALRRADNS